MGHWGAVRNSTVCLAVLMQLTVTTVQSGKQTLSEALADAGQRFSGEVIIKFRPRRKPWRTCIMLVVHWTLVVQCLWVKS